ncbi:MAG: sugar phosphate isomerase/epimerase [Pirellula sp.]
MFQENFVHRRQIVRASLTVAAASAVTNSFATGATSPQTATGKYFENLGWLIGCWTRPWASHDYRVGFDAIAGAGFRYVALTGAKTRTGRVISAKSTIDEAKEVGEEARKRGLTITTVYGGDVDLDKGPQELSKMLELCQAAGGWSVLLSKVGDEKTYESCCKVIAESCLQAAKMNLAIVLKPHGGTTGTGPQLRDCIQRVAHKNFTLMYDPGNIFFYSKGNIDPVEDCRAVGGMVTALSVKDFLPPDQVMLTPGTGKVQFPSLIKSLRESGFAYGPLLIEAIAPGDLSQLNVEAKKAKSFIEGLINS